MELEDINTVGDSHREVKLAMHLGTILVRAPLEPPGNTLSKHGV